MGQKQKSIEAKLKALAEKRKADHLAIDKKYYASVKKATSGMMQCNPHNCDRPYKLNLKTKKIYFDDEKKPCGKWSDKKDWLEAVVERYTTKVTSDDGWYGDYSRYAMVRQEVTYMVCPHCGTMEEVKRVETNQGPAAERGEKVPGWNICPRKHWFDDNLISLKHQKETHKGRKTRK